MPAPSSAQSRKEFTNLDINLRNEPISCVNMLTTFYLLNKLVNNSNRRYVYITTVDFQLGIMKPSCNGFKRVSIIECISAIDAVSCEACFDYKSVF